MGFKNWWNKNVVGTQDVTVDGPIVVGDDSFACGDPECWCEPPEDDAQDRLERNPHAVEAIREGDKDLENGDVVKLHHDADAETWSLADDYALNPPTRDELAGPIDLYPNQIGGAVVTVNGRTVFNSEKRKRKADVTIQFDPDKGLVTLDITELTD
ncbi:hypothetical protein HOT82_gp024 [Gordonia phage Ronaldo]|uniref:Uncharacterized protein n=2 Tax=Ronaldovirus ronaldo TaxID=2734270 RepID=A0A6B9L8U1_9CAUD|nr:hypothetical protein HOT82_gp024 [Gordonia phage Ronaldo]AXN53586.1 hypothetical protein SEA_RONALDO_24 [Gordonia phage Ronaldo]QHB38140.1 hypothetical protein SEA_VOLT_23 [Gordonia phage Volt]